MAEVRDAVLKMIYLMTDELRRNREDEVTCVKAYDIAVRSLLPVVIATIERDLKLDDAQVGEKIGIHKRSIEGYVKAESTAEPDNFAGLVRLWASTPSYEKGRNAVTKDPLF
jgi:hypothetical protein